MVVRSGVGVYLLGVFRLVFFGGIAGIMHSCPECDQTCYCDMEDADMEESSVDCVHECDESPDDEDDTQ